VGQVGRYGPFPAPGQADPGRSGAGPPIRARTGRRPGRV